MGRPEKWKLSEKELSSVTGGVGGYHGYGDWQQ